MKSIRIISVVLSVFFSIASSFVPVVLPKTTTRLSEAALGDLSAPRPPLFDPDLLEAAREKLAWEVLLETEQSAVLDLSSRLSNPNDLSLSAASQATTAEMPIQNEPITSRGDKQYWTDEDLTTCWTVTRQRLVDLWVLPRDMSNGADENYAIAASKSELKMLREVPQLLRLEHVVESAQAVLALGLPPALLRQEPVLMTFPVRYIQGGYDFLATMMMLTPEDPKVKQACQCTPGLLAGAVDGYIQEQTVQRALGDAAQATSTTNQHLAAEVANAFRSFKSHDN